MRLSKRQAQDLLRDCVLWDDTGAQFAVRLRDLRRMFAKLSHLLENIHLLSVSMTLETLTPCWLATH